MPVVFNNATKRAEELSPEEADKALSSGTHSIPMLSSNGELQAIPVAKLSDAMKQGFKQPGETDLRGMLDQTEHSTPQAQARTTLRSFGNMATLGLFDVAMSKIAEQTKGITPEQYAENARKDAEANPGLDFAGKVAGVIVPGTPVAKGLQVLGSAGTRFGVNAAKAMGLAESGFAAKALQTGAREAAQAALIQTGDEVSKQFVMEPDKSIGQSLIDVGLASTLGAAVGVGASAGNKFVAQPLWKATKESHIGKIISGLRANAEGVPVTSDVDAVVARSGMEVAPEIKAKLTSNPAVRQEAEALAKSTSAAGRKIREAEESFVQNAEKEVLATLGKAEKDIDKPLSMFEQGKALKDNISKTVQNFIKQADEAYAPVEEVLKKEFLPSNFVARVRQRFDEEATKRGYFQAEGLGEAKKINKIISELEGVKTFDQLKTFVTRQEKTLKSERLFELKSVVSDVLRSNQKEARKEIIGMVAPKALKQLQDADALYSSIRSKLGPLGERFGIKATADPNEFLRKLSKIKDENVLRVLTTSKDAELVNVIQSQFPELADALRQAHLNKIPLERAKGVLNLKSTLSHIDDLSPEVKEFVLGSAKADKLSAIEDLLGRLGRTKEGRMADSIIGAIPGGLGSLIGILTGGYPGAIAGYAIGKVGKEAASAARLAILRSIASGTEVSGSGFRAMFEAANAAYRGAAKQQKAISSLFKPTTALLETIAAPTAKSLQLLDRVVTASQVEPEKLMNVSGDLQESMPEHSAALAGISARAVSYLASMRPNTTPDNPLEPPRKPSDVEMAKYNRALTIVEQPLMILKHVKEGTITGQDVTTISTVYPELYDSMKEQVLDKVLEYKQKGIKLDYSTVIGLSVFLGMDLSSSLKPANIMANQAIHAPPMPEPVSRGGTPKALKNSKLPNIYSTPEQLREQKRSK